MLPLGITIPVQVWSGENVVDPVQTELWLRVQRNETRQESDA